MLHWLLTIGFWAGLSLPLALMAYAHIRKVKWSWFFIFLVVYLLNGVLMVVAKEYLNIGVFARSELGWWQIKLASIVWGVAFVFLYKPISLKEFGLTIKLRPGSLKLVVISSIIVAASLLTYHYLSDPFGTKSTEYIIFQSTMPGLAEELTYRGIFLALLNRAFGKSWNLFGAKIGWGFIIVTVLFGAVHGISVDPNMDLHINYIPIAITGFFGVIFAWMKERTGSIYPSIIAHNLFNVVSNI